MDTLQHGAVLLSANFTKATAPSAKVSNNIKTDNMRFRALLLMEESSAFSKEKILLLRVFRLSKLALQIIYFERIENQYFMSMTARSSLILQDTPCNIKFRQPEFIGM